MTSGVHILLCNHDKIVLEFLPNYLSQPFIPGLIVSAHFQEPLEGSFANEDLVVSLLS